MNELFFSLISYCIIFFTEICDTMEQKYSVGWKLIGFAALCVFINFMIAISLVFKQLILLIKKSFRIIKKFFEIANEKGFKEAYLYFNKKPANKTIKVIASLPSKENMDYLK